MSTEVTPGADEARVEEFAGRLFELYAAGMVTFMIDVGYRTGLFEAAARGAATSEELAGRAGLQERYVREWAGSLVTGGVLEYDPAARTYRLPPEHAACLTGHTSANLAPFSQINALLGANLRKVVRAFRDGGGVPSAEFRPEFTDVMDSLGRGTYDELLVDGFLPLAGEVPARLAAGARVADVGCGAGHCVNLLAQAYPASRFVGYDLAEDAVAKARQEAAEMGLRNVSFEVRDAAELPLEGFDVVFAFDTVHDLAEPARVLRRVRDALVADGWFVMVDPHASSNLEDNVGNPLAPWLYGVSTLYCMTVSLAQGGAGLGTLYGEQAARRLLGEAGFTGVEVRKHPSDPLDAIYVARRAG